MAEFESYQVESRGLRGWTKRLLKERELILRSDGRVYYPQLAPRLQAMVFCLVAGLTAWFAAANGIAWWQEQRIIAKESEIVEARVAYERLHGELSAYRERIASLARDILEHRGTGSIERAVADLEVLSAVTAGIENAFDRISRDLDLTEADRQRIIQSRETLHDRIGKLERLLTSAHDRIEALSGDISDRDQQIEVAQDTNHALTSNRDAWRGQAEKLDADLKAALARIGILESELDSTLAALSEERSRVEDLADVRERLTIQIDLLQSGIAQAEARGKRLAENVASLTETLDTVQRERIEVVGEREELSTGLALVEAELSLHQEATERTRARLEAVVLQLSELTHDQVGLDGHETNALNALETQIGDLAAELRTARNNAADMETAIGEVVVGLSQVAGDSPARLDSIADPGAKVSLTRELLEAIASVQEDQHDMN